jgi:hypothetical protein
MSLENWELLSYIVTVFDLPLAIVTFFSSSARSAKMRRHLMNSGAILDFLSMPAYRDIQALFGAHKADIDFGIVRNMV